MEDNDKKWPLFSLFRYWGSGKHGSSHSVSASRPVPTPATSPPAALATTETSVGQAWFPEKPNLWQLAYDSFENDEKISTLARAQIEVGTSWSPKSFVEDAVALIRKRCAEYQQSEWLITTPEGRKTRANDKAKSILCSVLEYKELIDAGLNFDATGCGAAAWSVVSFGLQLVQNDQDRMDAIFAATDYLTSLLSRYASIERNFGDERIDDWDKLQSGTVEVYAAVLRYVIAIREAQEAPTSRRIVDSFRALTEDPLQTLKDAVLQAESKTEQWKDIVEHNFRRHESAETLSRTEEILNTLEGISGTIQEIHQAVKDDEEHRMREWLSQVNSLSLYHSHVSAMKEHNFSTGEWLLVSKPLQHWKRYPQSVLWICGHSGTGKSFLCSTVLRHLQSLYADDKKKLIVSWYCDMNGDTCGVEPMIRYLIRQLTATRGGIPTCIRNMIIEHLTKGTRPTCDILLPALHNALGSLQKDVYILIDGFFQSQERRDDPFPASHRKFVQDLVDFGHGNVHLLFTSEQKLNLPGWWLDISNDIRLDIHDFVRSALTSKPELKDAGTLQEILLWTELFEPRTSFLWVSSKIKDFLDCNGDVEKMRKITNKSSPTVESMYEHSLEQIAQRYRKPVRDILRLMVLGCHPHRNQAATFASIMEPEDIAAICPSLLVTISPEPKYVLDFSHPSVRQFLTSQKLASSPNLSEFHIDIPAAQTDYAEYCLDLFLNQKESQFKTCAARSCWESVHAALEGNRSKDIEQKVRKLFDPAVTEAFLFFRSAYAQTQPGGDDSRAEIDGSDGEGWSPVHFCIRLNFIGLALHWINECPQGLLRQLNMDISILWCLSRGHYDIVEALIGLEPTYKDPGSLIREGSLHDQPALFQKLLRSVSKSGMLRNSDIFGAALLKACSVGAHANVKILLQNGADPNFKSEDMENSFPLQVACQNGYVDVVKTLLEHGCDVNNIAKGSLTAYQTARQHRRKEICDLLIMYGARVHYRSGAIWKIALQRFISNPACETISRPSTGPYYGNCLMTINHALLPFRDYRLATIKERCRDHPMFLREMETPEQIDHFSYYFVERHIFRANLRSIISSRDMHASHVPQLQDLYSIWRRTYHYEDMTGESDTEYPFASQLDLQLTELFTNMLHWLRPLHRRFNIDKPRSQTEEWVKEQDRILKNIKEIEEAVHVEARRMQQRKQERMLEDIRTAQTRIAQEMRDYVASQISELRLRLMEKIDGLSDAAAQDLVSTVSHDVVEQTYDTAQELEIGVQDLVSTVSHDVVEQTYDTAQELEIGVQDLVSTVSQDVVEQTYDTAQELEIGVQDNGTEQLEDGGIEEGGGGEKIT